MLSGPVASVDMSRIVIIGGHGKVALHLAPILTDRGDEVTSVFRNPDHTDDVSATGAHPVVADIEKLDTPALADLLAGHNAVVFSAGAGGGDPARTYAVDRDAAIRVIDAAGQAGVRRFVMVSYFGAGPDHGVPEDNSFYPYAEAKAAAEQAKNLLVRQEIIAKIKDLSHVSENVGAAVRKHPSQEYVVCLAVSTPTYEDI